jgi:hypothetical protein
VTSIFDPVVLPGLSFWSRHVHQTVAKFIEEQLANNGWVNDPVNFGTSAVHFEEFQPEEAGTDLVPNTVSISLGDVPEQQLEQLGGGLYSLSVPIFVDIYGAKISISVSIADDVRRLLTDRALPLFDWTDPANPVAMDTSYIEFERVIGPRQPMAAAAASADLKRNWRVVKLTAVAYFASDF